MATRRRNARGAGRARLLDCPHRNRFGIRGRLRAHLSGLADSRRLARGTRARQGMGRAPGIARDGNFLNQGMRFSERDHSAKVDGRRESMAVSKELLEILVCPQCKTPVKITADAKGLKCSTCRRVFPIRD